MLGTTLLRRGVTSAATGSGELTKPASGATITLWESSSNVASSHGGPRFKRLYLALNASHNSGTNGVKFQWSADGTNWRTYAQYTYLTGSGPAVYDVAAGFPYLKVTYTNSANTLTTWEMSLTADTCERSAA